jgi:hypothetical protein
VSACRGSPTPVVAKRNAVWVATVIAPAAKPTTGYDLIRIDPHTLHRVMLIHIG